LLKYLAELYRSDRAKINRQVEMIMNGLSMLEFKPKAVEGMDLTLLDEAALHLLDDADMVNGGFGSAPKFPNTMNLMFLLRYYRMKGISRFLNFVLFTLNKMADGGIHDHIGGGFHRYAVDARWMVPHFEKMLYDNALLAVLYAEAYQISRDDRYLEVMKGILDYMLREMLSSKNGFCSSQDADSESEEGKYYTWSMDEVRRLIGDGEHTEIFCAYYGMSEQGNFEGKNILHVNMDIDALASRFGKDRDELSAIIERCKMLLFNARASRVKPARDDKIILAWNALAISAMVKGYKVSGDDRYLDAAMKAVKMIEANMAKGSRLKRIYKDGVAKIDAYLDDYSSYINALLDLFEVDSRSIYLERAIAYTEHMLQHFWDSSNDLYYTSDEHEQLIVRGKNPYDLSTPSGNSMAALALIRLYHYTHKEEYVSKAESILKTYTLHAAENPFAYGNMLNVLYLYLKKPIEVTVIDASRDGRELWKEFMPECIVVTISKDDLDRLESIPFFSGKVSIEGKGLTAYVCKEFRCSLPLHSVEEVRRHILEET
ncbi:MAG: glycoside hydrolase family 76 protein, partial [Candidatus Nitrosocaldus sp.]